MRLSGHRVTGHTAFLRHQAVFFASIPGASPQLFNLLGFWVKYQLVTKAIFTLLSHLNDGLKRNRKGAVYAIKYFFRGFYRGRGSELQ